MGNSTSKDTAGRNVVLGEDTPLLLDDKATMTETSESKINFRRSARRPSGAAGRVDFRSSVRSTERLFPGTRGDFNDGTSDRNHLRAIDALAPLVAGGVIVATDGYKTEVHPPSVVKSLPAFAPFPRKARHRSFALWWINEFRHWWKSRYVPTSIYLLRLYLLWTED